MARFEHDGVEIAHEQRGAGPAFLFLHNGGASSTIWRPPGDRPVGVIPDGRGRPAGLRELA
jgi:pimeloyl-ACP methyl ester carboxylesterase